MSAGAEWAHAGIAARKQMIRRVWPFLDPASVNDQVTKAWPSLDAELLRRLRRAWTEARELEASVGDSPKAEKLDVNLILELVQRDDNSGLCIECGDEAMGVEPDARRYKCERCGAMGVYGAQELLIMTQD